MSVQWKWNDQKKKKLRRFFPSFFFFWVSPQKKKNGESRTHTPLKWYTALRIKVHCMKEVEGERERKKKKTHTEGNLARKLEGIRDHRLSMRQIQSKWRKDTSCLFHSCSYCFRERNFPVSWNVIAHISGNKLRWLWVNNTRHSIDQDTPDLSVFLFSFIPLIVTFLCVFLSLLFFFFLI